jgi:hypothetical protein
MAGDLLRAPFVGCWLGAEVHVITSREGRRDHVGSRAQDVQNLGRAKLAEVLRGLAIKRTEFFELDRQCAADRTDVWQVAFR